MPDAAAARRNYSAATDPGVFAREAILGSAVQDVVTDDARLRGLDVLIIDYDTDGAAETYDVPQKASNGAITHVATACLSDRAIGKATGIHLSELWGHFLLNSPGNHEASPSAPSMVA